MPNHPDFTGLLPLLLILPLAIQSTSLVVDGSFDDWAGQPSISDPAGDGSNPHTDITSFAWGTNPGESFIYFMVERDKPNGNAGVYYTVHIDTNNNGSFSGADDRLLLVHYDPSKKSGQVDLQVKTGTGSSISSDSGDWGDPSSSDRSRAEWRVSFADLGIDTHQTINMYVTAGQNAGSNGDSAPDTGDITWSPVPVLGWPLLVAVFVMVVLFAWYRHGRVLWHPS